MWADVGIILLFLIQAALAFLTVCAGCSWMFSFLSDTEKSPRQCDDDNAQCKKERLHYSCSKSKRKIDNKNDYNILTQKKIKRCNAKIEDNSGNEGLSSDENNCNYYYSSNKIQEPVYNTEISVKQDKKAQYRMSSADSSNIAKEEAVHIKNLYAKQSEQVPIHSFEDCGTYCKTSNKLIHRADKLRASIEFNEDHIAEKSFDSTEYFTGNATSGSFNAQVLPTTISGIKHEKTQPLATSCVNEMKNLLAFNETCQPCVGPISGLTFSTQLIATNPSNFTESIKNSSCSLSPMKVNTSQLTNTISNESTKNCYDDKSDEISKLSSSCIIKQEEEQSISKEYASTATSLSIIPTRSNSTSIKCFEGLGCKRKASATAITLQLLSVSHDDKERYKLFEFCRPLLKTVAVDQCISGLANFLVNKMSYRVVDFNKILKSLQKIQELLAPQISDYLEAYLIFEALDIRVTERFPLEGWLIAIFAHVKGDFKEEQVFKCIKELELDSKTLKAIVRCFFSVKKISHIKPCDIQRAFAALTEVVLRRSMRIRTSKSGQKSSDQKQVKKEKKDEILGSCWAPRVDVELDEGAISSLKRENLDTLSLQSTPCKESISLQKLQQPQNSNNSENANMLNDVNSGIRAVKEENEENFQKLPKHPKKFRVKLEV